MNRLARELIALGTRTPARRADKDMTAKLDVKIRERILRAESPDDIAIRALGPAIPDGPMQLADDGNRVAGSPEAKFKTPKSGKDQGIGGTFSTGGKRLDLDSEAGIEQAYADGDITTEQYRKFRKGLGLDEVPAESSDDSQFSDHLDETDELETFDEMDEDEDDEEDEDSDDEDFDGDAVDVLRTAPKTVRRKTARVHASLTHIETAAGTNALDLVGKFTWDEIEKGMREAQLDLEINPDLPSSRRARLRRLIAEGVPPVQAQALVKMNARELAS
jgi:hypothetical protein